MRQKRENQPRLFGPWPGHPLACELEAMARILDCHPVIGDLAWQDLTRNVSPKAGAPGMDAVSVVKASVLQKLMGVSFEKLAFHLADSHSCRAFMAMGPFDKAPGASTLQENVSAIKARTWEAINRVLMEWAKANGIEPGCKMRFDCTAVEANIHRPTDSSLLNDLVRVICRTLQKAGLPKSFRFRDRRRVARKLAFNIAQATTDQKRKTLYRKLIRHGEDLYQEVLAIVMRLDKNRQALGEKIAHWLDLMKKVVGQARQRVLLGKSVPARQKVVSIFETHADIISKGQRETVFGHKICLAGGASGLITDCTIEYGNPADSDLAPKMIVRHKGIFGQPPRQAAFDGGFASKPNLKAFKAYGVADVAFHKKRGLKVSDMVKSSWVYKQLRNFRAGIEGNISTLKRAFGLSRCNWRGRESFHAYVWTSILAYNLTALARHCLDKALL